MSEIPNAQRALWSFLLIMLVAPLFAALATVSALLAAPLLGVSPTIATNSGASAEPLGLMAMRAYVWSAIPSALAAFGLVPMVLKRGTFGWIEAGVSGVIGFAAALVLAPLPVGALAPYMAFAFGLLIIGVRQMLVGRILL